MKITHNKIGRNLNLVDTNKSDIKGGKSSHGASSSKGVERAGAAGLDKLADLGVGAEDSVGSTRVDVSQRGLDAKRIKDLAMAVPDVDEMKVAKYQKLIDEGKYEVDSRAVADRMVDEHLTTAD